MARGENAVARLAAVTPLALSTLPLTTTRATRAPTLLPTWQPSQHVTSGQTSSPAIFSPWKNLPTTPIAVYKRRKQPRCNGAGAAERLIKKRTRQWSCGSRERDHDNAAITVRLVGGEGGAPLDTMGECRGQVGCRHPSCPSNLNLIHHGSGAWAHHPPPYLAGLQARS